MAQGRRRNGGDCLTDRVPRRARQVQTTKGTGGDIIILEEAAQVDPAFFYETVAPLMIVRNTCMLAISTLTSEINFYTRLVQMKDRATQLPLFKVKKIELVCQKCKDDGKASECVHMLHMVPRWQSSDKHVKLKTVMEDRPDLIESELSGMAFNSLQQVFRSKDLEIMFTQPTPDYLLNQEVHIIIDPAAGGAQSDYAILSLQRSKGLITVSPPPLHFPHDTRYASVHFPHDTRYASVMLSMMSCTVTLSSFIQLGSSRSASSS